MSRPPRPRNAGHEGDGVDDKLQVLHDTLTAAVASLADGQQWQRMLRTAALFHHYSPHNVLLITAQFPQAQAVAGYQTWRQLDRQVRKGEKGIAILAPVVRRAARDRRPDATSGSSGPVRDEVLPAVTDPAQPGGSTRPGGATRRLAGFRVVHVFDISQTDGPDLPTPPRPDLLEGTAPPGLVQGLTTQVQQAGFTVSRQDFTALHPALDGANGVTDFLARTVQVRPGLSDAQACKTLAHELGHVLLHEPATRPLDVTREVGEVEAESVAYIVAAAHGLDTARYTVPYVASWASGDLTMLRVTAERVLFTARRILDITPPEATYRLPDSVRTPDLTRDITSPTPTRTPTRTPDRQLDLTGTPVAVLDTPGLDLTLPDPVAGGLAVSDPVEHELPLQRGLW